MISGSYNVYLLRLYESSKKVLLMVELFPEKKCVFFYINREREILESCYLVFVNHGMHCVCPSHSIWMCHFPRKYITHYCPTIPIEH